MTYQRMIELLEIEHECMLRKSHDVCDGNCCVCELAQDDYELHEMYINVISTLKAQEPRVMTLQEYKALAEKPKEERDPVWEEWPGLESTWAIPNQAYGGYGTSWRCWTSRPTDEQREATPWNAQK